MSHNIKNPVYNPCRFY